MRHTVVIVGGGFSGAVLAIDLLRRPLSEPTDLILMERNAELGRGVAYAQRDFPYLLNVAAGRLSIDPSDPQGFLQFARRYDSAAEAGDFLPRAWYGDYLEDSLRRAESLAPAQIRLQRVHTEVRDIEADKTMRLRVLSAGHPPILADRVVLALGNPPPPLLPWAEEVQDHRGYLHDPWRVPQDLEPHHAVLVIGNGLTMADVVLALTHERDQGPAVHTLSRRGLVPLSQSQERVDPSAETMRGDGAQLLAASHSLRELLRTIRRLVRESQARGGDWRPVIQLVRHWAQQLWRALPDSEQRRFVRHLQPIWSVHRHRQPPQSARRLEQLREQGRLQVKAGRIQKMAESNGRIKVWWEPRGAADCESLQVDWVINALGPDYVLERTTDPLTQSLLKSGMIVADALQLGLRTGAHGACIDREGRTSERLFYLGPMLRAGHWEITGAAELVQWAEDLAEHLRAEAQAQAQALGQRFDSRNQSL
jgi:uncharacterized NAD(P)/FAD-binding protein YdhS